MYKKRLIAGLGALLLCLQTSNVSTILAIGSSNDNYDPNSIVVDFNQLGTDIDLKIKLEVSDNYTQVINYSDLNLNSDGNGLLSLSNIPENTSCSLIFIDGRYTDATNDDAIIYTIENLNKYDYSKGKYKLDGVYQAYNVTLNPLTENSQASIVLNTYLNGDISLDGSFKSNDLLMLKQQLLFGYNMIQTGAYSSEDKTGGNILISGKNNYYCNNLNINGNIYAENSMKLISKNNPVKNNLLCYDITWIYEYGDWTSNQFVTTNDATLDNFNTDILLSDDDINTLYFSDESVIENITEITEQNLSINDDKIFTGEITFNAINSMNLNGSIKAEGDININGEVHNANNAIIYSKQNITIENESTFSFTGMIYAPNGIVTIKSNNVNITGCIIAKELIIESDNVNFNVNNYVMNGTTNQVLSEHQLFLADMNNDGVVKTSDLLLMKRILSGLDPDSTYISYDKWDTLEDSDGDGIPDIFVFDNWSNLVDWDEDGIPDSVESYYGTNRYIKDTDNDGLTDYYELFNTYTDPTIYDSLVEGISDGNLDLDEDGLTNVEEVKYGTKPLIRDTDEDGLSDFDELFPNSLYSTREKTDPLNPDTNNNGILDGDEKAQQTYTKEIDSDVITDISIDGDFSKNLDETISINSIVDQDIMCANVVGLVGEPFEIETTSEFDTSTITFHIDNTKLNDLNLDDLLLLWYDEENDNFVELNTQVNAQDGTISVNTTHFSKYMIVDKEEWFKCWRESPKYLENYDAYIPYDTAICIDCSGSMRDNDSNFIYNQKFPNLWVNSDFDINKYTNYRELAVERYIWTMNQGDKISLIHYEDINPISSENICGFTDNKDILINNLHPFNGGGTKASLAIDKAINDLSNQNDGNNRMIILLCDGDINFDTSESDADGFIALAKQYDIKIYTIGLGSSVNSSKLEDLATATGGEYFSAITADELYKKYNDILAEQYQSIEWEDDDEDGIPDYFETQGLMLSNGQIFFTDPTNPDSDGDGLLDGEEIVVTYDQKYIQGAGNEGHSISAIYCSYKSDPNKVDTDDDGILDFEDTLPLKPFVDGKYNRDFAIYYANKYYQSYNPDYPNLDMNSGDGSGDCTNFVSQCLLYGGVPTGIIWSYQDKDNFSHAWSFSKWNYNYFSKCQYKNDTIKLEKSSDISEAIKEYNIESGDLVYFINEDNGAYHCAIVYKVENNDIIYAAHSIDKIDGSVARHFNWIETNENGETVVIVTIKDNLYGN